MTRYSPAANQIVPQSAINALLNASVPENADLSEQGYFSLLDYDHPPITQFQTADLSEPFIDGGQWRRSWIVTDRPIADVRAELECTDLQALLALDAMGLAEAYEAWSIDPARTFAEKAFINRARIWKRLDATFNAAADSLGKTEAEKDQFFQLASTF